MVLVGYGSNENRLRVYGKVDLKMVCHSDRKYLPQRVLLEIHQFSEAAR